MTAQSPEDANLLESTSPRDTFIREVKSIPCDDTITMRDVVDYFHKHNIGQDPRLRSTSVLRFLDGEVFIDVQEDTVVVRGEELTPAGVMWAVQTFFAVRNKSSGVADMIAALADGTPIQEGEINEAALGILRHKASIVTIPGVGRVAYRVVKTCGQDHQEMRVVAVREVRTCESRIAYYRPGAEVKVRILMEGEDGPLLGALNMNGWRMSRWGDGRVAQWVMSVDPETLGNDNVFRGGDAGTLAALEAVSCGETFDCL